MQPSVVCPLLTVFSLTFEGDLRLRSQSCGTRDAGWFARSHVLDACRTVEVERAGRGCDEDRQAVVEVHGERCVKVKEGRGETNAPRRL